MFAANKTQSKSSKPTCCLSKARIDSAIRSMNRSIHVESLEHRMLLSGGTFTVSNLNDSGAGSLRQAITSANAAGGADLIQFSTGGKMAFIGTINLASQL